MKILYAASEATPFAKSGGLADVAGSLPKALVKDGVDARVIMPLYGDLKMRDKLEYVTNYSVPVGWRSHRTPRCAGHGGRCRRCPPECRCRTCPDRRCCGW